jgi:hypothetical protein
MNEKMNHKSKFICNNCNKFYASKSSLCNHNKKFHNTNNNFLTTNNNFLTTNNNFLTTNNNFLTTNNKIYNCKYCNKIYNLQQSKWKHEQNCKNKTENNNEIEILKNTIKEMKEQFALILKEKGKMHYKTLQKFNNSLNNNSNNNINYGKIINNINTINNTYVKFGDLDYEKVLNNKQIRHILNHQYMSLEESIKKIHFNENLPEYSNIFITNMKDDLAYVFNGNQFISVRKNEMLNELIDSHIKEINLSLEKNKNKLNEKYVIRLEKFLDMLNDDDTKFTDQDNQRVYPSYKAYKLNSIKLLIYNKSDKKKLDTLQTIELEEKIYEIDNNID